MTSPREVLEKYFGRPLSMEWDGEEGFSNKESITIALSDLAEIVSGMKKVSSSKHYTLDTMVGYNQAIDHIAKLFDKEQTKKGER